MTHSNFLLIILHPSIIANNIIIEMSLSMIVTESHQKACYYKYVHNIKYQRTKLHSGRQSPRGLTQETKIWDLNTGFKDLKYIFGLLKFRFESSVIQ